MDIRPFVTEPQCAPSSSTHLAVADTACTGRCITTSLPHTKVSSQLQHLVLVPNGIMHSIHTASLQVPSFSAEAYAAPHRSQRPPLINHPTLVPRCDQPYCFPSPSPRHLANHSRHRTTQLVPFSSPLASHLASHASCKGTTSRSRPSLPRQLRPTNQSIPSPALSPSFKLPCSLQPSRRGAPPSRPAN
jgi:hypothetical protein